MASFFYTQFNGDKLQKKGTTMQSIIEAVKVVVESYKKNCETHRELTEIECRMRSNSAKF